jgi:hypothetical protein
MQIYLKIYLLLIIFINITIQKTFCKDKLKRVGHKEREPSQLSFLIKGQFHVFFLQVVGTSSKGQDPSALAQEQQNKLT